MKGLGTFLTKGVGMDKKVADNVINEIGNLTKDMPEAERRNVFNYMQSKAGVSNWGKKNVSTVERNSDMSQYQDIMSIDLGNGQNLGGTLFASNVNIGGTKAAASTSKTVDFGNLGGIKQFPERQVDIYAGVNKNKLTSEEIIKERDLNSDISVNSSFTDEQRKQAAEKVREINTKAQEELSQLQSTKDIEEGYKKGEQQWRISQEQDRVKEIQRLDDLAASGDEEAAAEAQKLRNEAQSKLNNYGKTSSAGQGTDATSQAVQAEERKASTKLRSRADVETAVNAQDAGWFGGKGTNAATMSRYDSELKDIKESHRALMKNGATREQVEEWRKGMNERYGTEYSAEDIASGNFDSGYWKTRNGKSSFGDYMTGNQVVGKAAGVGVVALTASAVMGDGRRSNAQLYSSPF